MSGRKRISKWDLPQSSTEHGNLTHDGGADRNSFGISGTNDVKGSFMESNDMRRHIIGSRNSERDGTKYRDSMKESDLLTEWDGDGGYSMRMSPRLDEWRKRSRSPRSRQSRRRSRSQSRSPSRGLKHEAEESDKGRTRSGLSTHPCRDFSAGRCRRGDDCHFLHQSKRTFEDRRYPEDGSPDGYESRHIRDGTSMYSSNTDTKEIPYRAGRLIRERDDESNNRGSSFERGGWRESREPRRTGDVPCKFFASGNCRNGDGCRFSHYVRSGTSSDGKSRDDRLAKDNKSDHPYQSTDTKYNGSGHADGATWNGPTWNGEKHRNHDGPTWHEETHRNQDGPTCNEEKHRNQGVLESRSRASPWSKADRQDYNITFSGPDSFDKAFETNGNESILLKLENTDSGRGAIASKDNDNAWLGDMEMSPEWNYAMQAPNDASNDKYGYANRSSQSINLKEFSSKDNVIQDVSGQLHHTASANNQNIVENVYVQQYPRLNNDVAFPHNSMNVTRNSSGSSVDLNFSNNNLPGLPYKNGQISTVPPHSRMSPVVQSQHGLTLDPPRGGGNQSSLNLASAFQEEKPINMPNMLNTSGSQIMSEFPIVQPTVSTEQLAQISNISASLAQLFGSQQQLPQLYASLNTPKAGGNFPSLSQSTEPVTQPMTAIISQKPYDMKSDSSEKMKSGITNPPPMFSPNSIGQKMMSDINTQRPSNDLTPLSNATAPNNGNLHKTGSLLEDHYGRNEQLKQSEQATTDNGKKNNEKVPEESKNVRSETKKPGEGSPVDVDERKKSKDVKGLRAFKFSLVEFIKELLKPSWKDGKINKDGYKIIVKKVTDKVTGAIQAANIPQTQEKIDQYLSFSKPKLTKLVQAYVEKHQKS